MVLCIHSIKSCMNNQERDNKIDTSSLHLLDFICRSVEPEDRPAFSDIISYLEVSNDIILQWNSEDLAVSKMASILGAPLIEGENLYKNLQLSNKII